jgi:hypothetical protein
VGQGTVFLFFPMFQLLPIQLGGGGGCGGEELLLFFIFRIFKKYF